MIDVHILTQLDDNPEWFDQCLNSLKDEPIVIYQLDGIKNNITQSRINGFNLGTNPYISFVDPDDYILPGGFQKCIDILNNNSNCHVVYTFEYVVGINGIYRKDSLPKPWAHHIIVFRRSVLDLYLESFSKEWVWPMPISEGQYLINRIKNDYGNDSVIEIPKPFYVWRRHIYSFISRHRGLS